VEPGRFAILEPLDFVCLRRLSRVPKNARLCHEGTKAQSGPINYNARLRLMCSL